MITLKYSDLTPAKIEALAKTHPHITSFDYNTEHGGQWSYQEPIGMYHYQKKGVAKKWYEEDYNGKKHYFTVQEFVNKLKEDKETYTHPPMIAVVIQAFTPAEYDGEETDGGAFLIEENLPKYGKATLEGHSCKPPVKKCKKNNMPRLNVRSMF